MLYDKDPPGWLVWNQTISLYTLPDPEKPTFQPWEQASEEVIETVRDITTEKDYWENIALYYSEENHETSITQDNVSCVKSICTFPTIMSKI